MRNILAHKSQKSSLEDVKNDKTNTVLNKTENTRENSSNMGIKYGKIHSNSRKESPI